MPGGGTCSSVVREPAAQTSQSSGCFLLVSYLSHTIQNFLISLLVLFSGTCMKIDSSLLKKLFYGDCLASFPGLPRCIQYNTRKRKTQRKWRRPGLIHHMNDVRWTRGGYREEGPNCKNNALDHPFKHSNTVLDLRC